MDKSRKEVYMQTGWAAIGQVICTGIMLAVFALLHKFDLSVALGGLVGIVLALGNFFASAMIASLAADKAEQQDVDGGKKLLKASYPLRILVLGGLLVLCAISKWFNLLALVLPLAYMPIILLILAAIQKKKGA